MDIKEFELYPGVSRRSLSVELKLAEAVLHAIANCVPQQHACPGDVGYMDCEGCKALIEFAGRAVERLRKVQPDL